MAATESGRVPVDDSFGNLMLAGLDEINLPEAVSLWPQAQGWKYLAILLLGMACYFSYKIAQRWWKNRYRRAAIDKLSEIEGGTYDETILYRLAFLIKATALQIYPRTEIASLYGAPWFSYLNEKSGKHFFDARCIELLGVAQYQRSKLTIEKNEFSYLVTSVRAWIEQHPLPEAEDFQQKGANDV